MKLLQLPEHRDDRSESENLASLFRIARLFGLSFPLPHMSSEDYRELLNAEIEIENILDDSNVNSKKA